MRQYNYIFLCISILCTGCVVSAADNAVTFDLPCTDTSETPYAGNSNPDSPIYISEATTQEVKQAIDAMERSQSELCLQLPHMTLPLPEAGRIVSSIYADIICLYDSGACSYEDFIQCSEYCYTYTYFEKGIEYHPIIDPNDKNTIEYVFTRAGLCSDAAYLKILMDLDYLYFAGACTYEQAYDVLELAEMRRLSMYLHTSLYGESQHEHTPR